VARAWGIRWEDDLGSGNDVFGTVLASAFGGQAAALVPIEVELDHGDRLTDDESVTGHRDVILEGLPERPELFTVSIGIDCDLLNQVVQMIERATSPGFHRALISYSANPKLRTASITHLATAAYIHRLLPAILTRYPEARDH
jgi:hypothetical protein